MLGLATVLDLLGDSDKPSGASVSPHCTAGQWQISSSTSSRGLLVAGAELTAPWPHEETEAGHIKVGLGGPEWVCALTTHISCCHLLLLPLITARFPGDLSSRTSFPMMLH